MKSVHRGKSNHIQYIEWKRSTSTHSSVVFTVISAKWWSATENDELFQAEDFAKNAESKYPTKHISCVYMYKFFMGYCEIRGFHNNVFTLVIPRSFFFRRILILDSWPLSTNRYLQQTEIYRSGLVSSEPSGTHLPGDCLTVFPTDNELWWVSYGSFFWGYDHCISHCTAYQMRALLI